MDLEGQRKYLRGGGGGNLTRPRGGRGGLILPRRRRAGPVATAPCSGARPRNRKGVAVRGAGTGPAGPPRLVAVQEAGAAAVRVGWWPAGPIGPVGGGFSLFLSSVCFSLLYFLYYFFSV